MESRLSFWFSAESHACTVAPKHCTKQKIGVLQQKLPCSNVPKIFPSRSLHDHLIFIITDSIQHLCKILFFFSRSSALFFTYSISLLLFSNGPSRLCYPTYAAYNFHSPPSLLPNSPSLFFPKFDKQVFSILIIFHRHNHICSSSNLPNLPYRNLEVASQGLPDTNNVCARVKFNQKSTYFWMRLLRTSFLVPSCLIYSLMFGLIMRRYACKLIVAYEFSCAFLEPEF